MALQNLIYNFDGCLPSCVQGNNELAVGEDVKITLAPKNPAWPPHIIGKVTVVERTPTGRTYTIEFDDADLNGGTIFDGCDILDVACLDCCDVAAFCPEEIPTTAFANPASPTQTEIEAWFDANPQRNLSSWFIGGTETNPQTLIEIKDCGPVIVKAPAELVVDTDTDTISSVTNNVTDPVTGNTTLTFTETDIDGNVTGTQDVTIPGPIDYVFTVISTVKDSTTGDTTITYEFQDSDGNIKPGTTQGSYTIEDTDFFSFIYSTNVDPSTGEVTLVVETLNEDGILINQSSVVVDVGIQQTFDIISNVTDPTTGDTTITYQYVDDDGNPVPGTSPQTLVVPGISSTEFCDMLKTSIFNCTQLDTRLNVTDCSQDIRILDDTGNQLLGSTTIVPNGFDNNAIGGPPSVPGNASGSYIDHNIRGENDGTPIDTPTANVAQKVLVEEENIFCTRATTIRVEDYQQNTIFLDQKYGNNATALPERRDRPFATATAAAAAMQDGFTLHVMPGVIDTGIMDIRENDVTVYAPGVVFTQYLFLVGERSRVIGNPDFRVDTSRTLYLLGDDNSAEIGYLDSGTLSFDGFLTPGNRQTANIKEVRLGPDRSPFNAGISIKDTIADIYIGVIRNQDGVAEITNTSRLGSIYIYSRDDVPGMNDNSMSGDRIELGVSEDSSVIGVTSTGLDRHKIRFNYHTIEQTSAGPNRYVVVSLSGGPSTVNLPVDGNRIYMDDTSIINRSVGAPVLFLDAEIIHLNGCRLVADTSAPEAVRSGVSGSPEIHAQTGGLVGNVPFTISGATLAGSTTYTIDTTLIA